MVWKRTGRVQFIVLLRLWTGPPQNNKKKKKKLVDRLLGLHFEGEKYWKPAIDSVFVILIILLHFLQGVSEIGKKALTFN